MFDQTTNIQDSLACDITFRRGLAVYLIWPLSYQVYCAHKGLIGEARGENLGFNAAQESRQIGLSTSRSVPSGADFSSSLRGFRTLKGMVAPRHESFMHMPRGGETWNLGDA